MNPQAMDPALADCIAACDDCHRTCLAEIQHCLQRGGPHAAPDHIGLMMDCARVCATAADLMSTNSAFHPQMCAVCAQVCTACAEQCSRLGEMDDCVESCRDCADACEDMSTVAVGEAG